MNDESNKKELIKQQNYVKKLIDRKIIEQQSKSITHQGYDKVEIQKKTLNKSRLFYEKSKSNRSQICYKINKQKMSHNNLTENCQGIDLNDFQEMSQSSQEMLIEFARHSYPLVGAVIDENVVKGDFGYGEILKPRNERLVMIKGNQMKIIDKVSKIIITKSIIKKPIADDKKQDNQNAHEPADINAQPQPANIQPVSAQPQLQQEQYFSQSSSSQSQREQRQLNKQRKSFHIKKSAKNLSEKRQKKVGKNVLKKKLKFLTKNM